MPRNNPNPPEEESTPQVAHRSKRSFTSPKSIRPLSSRADMPDHGSNQVTAKKIKPYMWILYGVVFLIIVLSIILVSIRKTDESELARAGENMSAYLNDRYGVQFTVRDVKHLPGVGVGDIKVVTANVSPVNDPSFSYVAWVYLHSVLPGQKDSPTYREDFLGEYWKSGFDKTVCPLVRSIKAAFPVTKCSLTSYSLDEDYDTVLARHKGNIPSFSQLNESERRLFSFGLTIETSDNNNLSNVVKHAEFLEELSNIINTTHAESIVTYFSSTANSGDPKLGFMGNLGVGVMGEKIPIINKMFKQDAKPKSF